MATLAAVEPWAGWHGEPRTLAQPAVAAGAEVTWNVPGPVVWRPVSLVFRFVASAVVANRFIRVEYRDQTGTPFCESAPGLVVVANDDLTFAFSAHRGVAEWAANTHILVPLEPALLLFGEVVAIEVGNIDVGDQLSNVRLRVEQWPLTEYERR